MIELLIIGIVLFIAGVGGTIVYDKYKAAQASRPVAPPKPIPTPRKKAASKSIYEEEVDAFADFIKTQETKKKKAATNPAVQQLDQLLAQVKQRAAAGEKKLTITQGVQTQTMSVNELIKKLEDMKKKL